MIEYYISSVRCFDLFLIKRKFIRFNFLLENIQFGKKKLITPFRKLGSLLRRNCVESCGYFQIKNRIANLTQFVFKL